MPPATLEIGFPKQLIAQLSGHIVSSNQGLPAKMLLKQFE
jgi:hypothetical protein